MAKKKKTGSSKDFKMPARNRGFENLDIGDDFGEADILAGD